MSRPARGRNSTSYQGTNATQPPNWWFNIRPPTDKDTRGYVIGDLWMDTETQIVWGLTSLAGDMMSKGMLATWKQVSGSGTHLISLSDSAGNTVVANGSGPYSGEISLIGGDNITTHVTAAHTISVDLDANIDITALRIQTLPAGVMQTNGGGTVTSDNGASGELLVAGGAAAPAWSYLESALGTMVIRDTANHINLEAHEGTSIAVIDADVEEATPLAGAITISGRALQLNTDGAVANTVLINLDASPTIYGTLTVGDLVAASPGVVFTTAAGGTYAVNGADGQLIIADAAGGPAWGNVTSSGGTLTITTGPNILDLKLT